jgi:hypothetical protein
VYNYPFSELANSLLAGIVDSVREALDTLTRFLHPELSFSVKASSLVPTIVSVPDPHHSILIGSVDKIRFRVQVVKF